MAEEFEQPKGELSIRTLTMPKDTNPNGDIFGGWLMSQLDIAGAITAGAYSAGRVVTVGVEAMAFHLPVHVGDVLCCYTHIRKVGSTSITIGVEAWVNRRDDPSQQTKVTEGVLTYVAMDEEGHKRPIQK